MDAPFPVYAINVPCSAIWLANASASPAPHHWKVRSRFSSGLDLTKNYVHAERVTHVPRHLPIILVAEADHFWGTGGIGVPAVVFYPLTPEYARHFTTRSPPEASASSDDTFVSPPDAGKQRLAEAKTAVPSMYVKDPQVVLNMFPYLSARLSVTPVLDENKRPACPK